MNDMNHIMESWRKYTQVANTFEEKYSLTSQEYDTVYILKEGKSVENTSMSLLVEQYEEGSIDEDKLSAILLESIEYEHQQLLNEAVSDIKGEAYTNNDFVPQINLQAPALIPEAYILDLSLRLQLYRRLGNINNDNDFKSFTIELIDRFGLIPKELNYLIRVMKIKRNCIKTGIQRIDSGINGATLEFINDGQLNPEKFITWIHNNKRDIKVRSDKKVGLLYKWSSIDERLDVIEELTSELTMLLIS